jgi:hypothetical protein
MRDGGISKSTFKRILFLTTAFLALMAGPAARPSTAMDSNCSINGTGDMVCSGESGTGVSQDTALPTVSHKPDTATPQITGSGTVDGVSGCNYLQTVTLSIGSISFNGGTVTVKTQEAHQFKSGQAVTVAGTGGAMDGQYEITVSGDHAFTYKLPEGITPTSTASPGGITVTGDVNSSGDNGQDSCFDDPSDEQSKLDELNQQITELQQLYNQLEQLMNGMTLDQQQQLANQLANPQSGGLTGSPLSQLQSLLGKLGQSTPGGTMTGPLSTAEQQANQNGLKDTYSPNAKVPGQSGQVCNFDSTPVDPEKTLRSIDNQIGVRYCVKYENGMGTDGKTSTDRSYTCEGVNQKVSMQTNGTGNGETTLAKGELQKQLDTAKKLNEELKKPLTDAERQKYCPCKKDNASEVKNDPKNCFTTVMATAAFREGDGLNEKLKDAINYAKCGDFTKAGESANKALGGELGKDGDAAFKSLGGDNSAGSDGNLKDQRSKFANELQDPSVMAKVCGRMGTEDSKTAAGRTMFIESVMNRALARGWTLGSTVTNSHGRYFPTNVETAAPSQACKDAINSALNGSNTCNFCTGNGTTRRSFDPSSGIVQTVPCGGSTIVGKGCTGGHDRYVVEANPKDKSWNQNSKQNADKPSQNQSCSKS